MVCKIVSMSTENSQTDRQYLVVKEAPPPWGADCAVRIADDSIDLTARDWRDIAERGDLKDVRDGIAAGVGMRVRAAREQCKLTRVQVAQALGVHENTVAKIERGQTNIEAVMLLQLSAMTGKPMTWFFGDDSAAHEISNLPHTTLAYERGEMIYVPQFDIKAAAGNGYFNDVESVIAMRAFGIDYIRHALQIHHNDLAMITVVGTSAEPEIHSGDVVLVDRRDRDILVESLHLVRIDSGLLVKMVQRLPGGVLRVFSKNQRTSPFDINVSEGSHADFEVLGRVRWGGITFN